MADKPPEYAPTRVRFATPQEFIARYCEDPQLGGITIPTHVQLATGTRLDLTIDLGAGKGLRCVAEVMWFKAAADGRGGGVGVRFVQMSPAHQQWLQGAVQAAAPKVEVKGSERHMLRKAESGRSLEISTEDLSGDLSADKGIIIGIDLGTCNSSVCVFVDDKPTIINLADLDLPTGSPRTLPSVVAYDDEGRTTVGTKAQDGLPRNPRRTIFGAKRFIGRTYDSAAVQSMLGRFPYKVVPGSEGRVAIDINGRPVNLTTISAKILQAMRERTEKELARSVSRAVITVPAYYNDNQRNAVVTAGRLAGLTVERILNEPTAAAIAYGLLRSKPRRLLVYDLGGGTFDVSVMSVHHDHLQVLATAGDTFLGGEDFDDTLVKYAYEVYFAKNKKPLSQSPSTMAVIKAAAEAAKRRLSSKDTVMLSVREAQQADGTPIRLEIEVSRAEFEKRIEPYVSRTLKICDMALREAQLEVGGLGDVILVGGQTRMPYVQERVKQHFKLTPRCDLNPDEVVALGAGMLAHLPKGDGDAFKDVLSMSIGVAVGGRFKPLLNRNAQLPCSKQVKMNVPRSEWSTYALDVWQGDSPELHKNEHLGTLKVDAVEPGPQNPVPVQVDFYLTADCLLKVRVTNVQTQESQSVVLTTRDAGG